MLIDTDLIDKFNILVKKYSDISNIIFGNHIEIQSYFINNYYKLSIKNPQIL